MSNRILIAGYFGFGNTGDEAIAGVMTEHLRQAVPNVEITFVSGNPAHTAKAYGVQAVGWREPLAILDAVRNTDLTILGGGGLFQDYNGFDPDAVLTREHGGLSFYVEPALLSAIYAKPLMLYAVGVGPLLSDHGRKYTKAAGDIATRITVRDPLSKELLASLGVDEEKLIVTADPAFALDPAAEVGELPEVGEWLSSRPAIAVCLRTWSIGADRNFCERQIAEALDDILEKEGGRALFLPFQVDGGTGFGDDSEVARRIIAQLRHAGRAALLTQPYPPAMLAGIIANADLVLGMRLHSAIFSFIANVPFVALAYDPKVPATTAIVGLEEFTIPFGGIEADVLAQRMRRALSSKETFRRLAATHVSELRCRARQNAAIAAELLQGGLRVTEYGPDAGALIGRLVRARIASNENLIDERQAAVREREQELAGARAQNQALERELTGLRLRLDELRREAEQQSAILQERLIRLESHTPTGIAKRALQVFLDTLQLITPRPLRAAVRKYYLNWFYFRIYTERRPGRGTHE